MAKASELSAKNYMSQPATDAKAVEAKYVDEFVRGRPLVNEGTRLVNGAKGYFERSHKAKWKSADHRVTMVEGARAGFDMDAFKTAHPKLYAQFYRADLVTTKYEITEL